MSEEDISEPTAVYVWGNDTFGQLGLGKQQERTYSFPVLCTFNIQIAQVACGEEHSAFRTIDGLVYTMGSNADGRLGLNDRSLRLVATPTFVRDLEESRVSFISCGAGHTAVVTAAGQLYTWGLGHSGALGTGNSLSHWRPQLITFKEELVVMTVSCGSRHSAVIAQEASGLRKLVVFGAGDAGQLGLGRRDSELYPQVLGFSETILETSCGVFHTLFRTGTNRVFAMGGNSFGQLGIGSKRNSADPAHVGTLDGLGVNQLACGTYSAAVTEDGQLYLWGSGSFGEFLKPQKVKTVSLVQEVALGSSFGLFLDRSGLVWSWGNNTGGELGLGDFEGKPTPVPVTGLQGKTIRQIACGAGHVMALGEDVSAQRTEKVHIDVQPQLDLSMTMRASLSEVETQSHNRLLRLYQSELDCRKLLELELFKEQQAKLGYMKQVESLTLENQDMRDSVRKAETELAQRQGDISWHSQNNLQLAAKNKSLSDKLKEIPTLEQRIEELQSALATAEKKNRRAEENIDAVIRKNEDLEYLNKKVGNELSDTKSALRQLEGELDVAQRTKAESRHQLEKSSLEAELAIQNLSRRQAELESQWTSQLDEHIMKIQTQEDVIRDLRNRLQSAATTAERWEQEVARVEGKNATLQRDLADRNMRIEQLESMIEKQDVKNKALVDALEREVKERASSLKRTKDTLVSSGELNRSSVSLASDVPKPRSALQISDLTGEEKTGTGKASTFLQDKMSLEARMSAFEKKLNLGKRQSP